MLTNGIGKVRGLLGLCMGGMLQVAHAETKNGFVSCPHIAASRIPALQLVEEVSLRAQWTLPLGLARRTAPPRSRFPSGVLASGLPRRVLCGMACSMLRVAALVACHAAFATTAMAVVALTTTLTCHRVARGKSRLSGQWLVRALR